MKKETENWLRFASIDIHVVSENLNTDDPEATGIVAVLCQQAVEKYMKAYLIEHSITFPKTHDLLNLYGKIKTIKDWNISEAILDNLNGLYVMSRYPSNVGAMSNGSLPTLDEAKSFIDFAKSIERIFKSEISISQK